MTGLNQIEHLWDELEQRLRARPSRPTSVPDLTNVLLEEWSNIPHRHTLKPCGLNLKYTVTKSNTRIFEAAIAAKGGPTQY